MVKEIVFTIKKLNAYMADSSEFKLSIYPCFIYGLKSKDNTHLNVVVVVYHVTIVAIGHGLLKKFWPLVLGCVLHTAGSSII